MARVDSWSCDVCGKIKEAGNHWYAITNDKIGAWIGTWPEKPELYTFHLCGLEHAIKKLSEILGSER